MNPKRECLYLDDGQRTVEGWGKSNHPTSLSLLPNELKYLLKLLAQNKTPSVIFSFPCFHKRTGSPTVFWKHNPYLQNSSKLFVLECL